MFATMILTFVFDTAVGLATGIGASVVIFLFDVLASKPSQPRLLKVAKTNNGVDVVKIEGNLTFLTAEVFQRTVSQLHLQPHIFNTAESSSRSEKIFQHVTTTLDQHLKPLDQLAVVDVLPSAIVVDMSMLRVIDLTGLLTLEEVLNEARAKGVLVVVFNVMIPDLEHQMTVFGIKNDSSSFDTDLSSFLALSRLPLRAHAVESVPLTSTGEVELAYATITDSIELGGVGGDDEDEDTIQLKHY